MKKIFLILILLFLLSLSTVSVFAEPDPPLNPEDWQIWPVIPTLSETAKQIYQDGLAQGSDTHTFSRIADCQNISTVWLGYFDHEKFVLGDEYAYLQEVIDQFQGSFDRDGASMQGGFNVAQVLNPFYVKEEFYGTCNTNEPPVECELRVWHPSIAFISLEQNWSGKPSEKYGDYLRMIVERTIASGSLPILVTKADNLEGDHSINQMIAQIAYEFEIPLWNFWAAVQNLPAKGVSEDGFHITPLNAMFPDFTDEAQMQQAMTIRNLTGLQTLFEVWTQANEIID